MKIVEVISQISAFLIWPLLRRMAPRAANRLFIIGAQSAEQRSDIEKRAQFYAPGAKPEFRDKITPSLLFSLSPVLLASPPRGHQRHLTRILKGVRRCLCPVASVFNIDSTTYASDGWDWCALTLYRATLCGRSYDAGAAQRAFREAVIAAKHDGHALCYVFGTGTSLEKASERGWGDGYRIVCNTIVRDDQLWHHITPHFIVAGDAIYHFGHTTFAAAFRQDLTARMRESDATFLYPEMFREIVRIHLPQDIQARCIAIPTGNRQTIHDDLTREFSLPGFGNVLPLLLLPVGCTMARNVALWGFDGRAPSDKLFWSNSSKHSYPEHFHTLRAAHPAFFDHHVPKEDPEKYVRLVHGDALEDALQIAEKAGWTFRMLHHSWTGTLAKRFRP